MWVVVRNEVIIHYTSSIIHLLLHQTSYIKHHTSDGDFVNGTLSLSDLSEAMRLGKLGELRTRPT